MSCHIKTCGALLYRECRNLRCSFFFFFPFFVFCHHRRGNGTTGESSKYDMVPICRQPDHFRVQFSLCDTDVSCFSFLCKPAYIIFFLPPCTSLLSHTSNLFPLVRPQEKQSFDADFHQTTMHARAWHEFVLL